MRITAAPALLVTTLLVPACFNDIQPSDPGAGETSGDGDSGDGDGDAGDGDGDRGDGDGDRGDGDGDFGCEPGDCAEHEYCVSGICEPAPQGMVAIEAGPFWMGCKEDADSDCDLDEYPYHQVTLSAYAIDRTEVTAAGYEECVAQGECTPANANCETSGTQPIACLSWFQATAYCEWLGKQLPTEAQWEKAARGDDGRVYPWGDEPPSCATVLFDGCPEPPATPSTGSYPAGASPYGVLDMAGSVPEWTADWYSNSYYVESPSMDPVGPANGSERVYRSNLNELNTSYYRNSFRDGADPNLTITGVRCAYIP